MKPPAFLEKILPHKEEKQYFLALEIKSKRVKAAVWEKEKEKITLIDFGDASYSGSWEETIKAADEAIVEAGGDISQEKIEQVILGLPQDWTAENKILDPHLANLKKLCERLTLKPLGFVVIPEAIVNYLKQLEGVPPTALLIGLEEEAFTLTLAKAGRIEGTKVVKRTEEEALPSQIEKTLSNFSVEALPSRILLYNGREELEELKEDLLFHKWSDKLPFLHLPKIEILDKNFDIKALAMSSGLQMGGVITKEEMIAVKDEDLETSKSPKEEEETTTPDIREKGAVGFIKDKDILEEGGTEKEIFAEEEKEIPREAMALKTYEDEQEVELPSKVFKPSLPSWRLPKLKLPHIGFPFFRGAVKPFVFLLLILLLAALVYGAAWWYLPKAEVKIWLQTKPLEKEAEITLSSNSEGQENAGQVAGVTVEVEETAGKKASTTGKKTVGDPAKGKLTIYNKTENEKIFPRGIVLIGSSDLRFTLDKEVTVASTAAFSTSFSSVGGEITAAKIGPEGNLPGETNLSFKDYPTSSYFAKTDDGLSGGTSKEVSAVSKSDQEKLLEDLFQELSDQARENLQAKLGAEDKLIEETITSATKEKKFDKDVGEEASELNLTLSVKFQAVAYNEKEIKDRFLKSLEEATPEGYELNKDETKIEVLGVNKKEKETTLKMIAKVNLLPKLNLEEIRKSILGKKQSLAEEYLKGLRGVSQVEVIIKSPVPSPFKALPRLPRNIKIEIIST